MKADELKRECKDAFAYVSKVGAPEHHLSTVGRVHTLTVKTEICHQESPGAQNYWKNEKFDEVLSEVIRGQFGKLASEAMRLMRKRFEDALVAEKEQLLKRLAEIQSIEEQQ